MHAFIKGVLRFRYIILVVIVLISVGAGMILTKAVVGTSLAQLFLGNSQGYDRYLERIEQFGTDEIVIVALENADPLDPAVQDKLAVADRKLHEIEGVIRTFSVLSADSMRSVDDTLMIEKYADRAQALGDKREALRSELVSDHFVGGLLVSKDGKHTALMIEMEGGDRRPAELTVQIMKDIRRSFEEAGFEKGAIKLVGQPVSLAASMEATNFNLKRIFPITAVMLIIAVWLMFHRFWPVVFTMGVAIVAVLWTMAFTVLIDRHISVLVAIIPAVILVISFSDVVHLCSAYLLELGRGQSKHDAILAAGEDVGKACLYTSLTTFVGFVSIAMVPTPAFRQLGLSLGFGVGVALLLAVVLSPILFKLFPQPKPWREGATLVLQRALDRVLAGAAKFGRRRAWLATGVFAVILILSIMGCLRMHFEADITKRFDPDHPVRTDLAFYETRFVGSNIFEIYVTAPETDGLLDPELFSRIAAFQDELEAQHDVGKIQSLVDLMRLMHQALNGLDPSSKDLPATHDALAQYLLLFESSGGSDLERIVDFDRRTMRMTIYLDNQAIRATSELGRRAAVLAEKHLGDRAEVQVTGVIYLIGLWLDQIIIGQGRGLITAVVVITLLMMVALRSVRVGLASMIPNLIPLLALGGWLGWTWDPVDSDLIMIGMIAIGIGVDDTIHFLMRYRIESARCATVAEAIGNTFYFSGRGIIITTVILIMGFAPFELSSYSSLKAQGTLLPLTLIVALLADLYLVPALVTLGVMRFPLGKGTGEETGEDQASAGLSESSSAALSDGASDAER
ncbi:MAG: MMPL family transporter [Deltaproteobacteria bacterium]|nr:MMPL family transporter [Deltaproteobacteria bacterium]